MKLSKELISEILRKRVYDCSKEEIEAILRLVGCQLKEWYHSDAIKKDGDNEHRSISTCFEVHHRQFFLVEVSGDNSNRIVSYSNEWFMEHGLAMPTDNFGIAMHMVFNYLLPKLPVEFKGPQYDEFKDSDYGSMEHMQDLLNHLQEDMFTAMDESNKADEEKKAQRKSAGRK
jgi:hypothetical protein